jgi:phytoene dehydrogenase-like protein
MFGLHLGIDGGIRWNAEDPRVNDAMIVFCGLESEAELLAHLGEIDAESTDACEWLHVTNLSHFDATMAPLGHQLLRAEAVVKYGAHWVTHGKTFGDESIRLIGEFAQLDPIVFRRHTTPLDIEAKLTTMKCGSIKHGAYTALQMGYLRPNDQCSQSETPIPGLFVGGASMYPGGMILGGSGYIASQVVGAHLGEPSDE